MSLPHRHTAHSAQRTAHSAQQGYQNGDAARLLGSRLHVTGTDR